MRTVTVAAVALVLASAWQLPADTIAIGTISLQNGLLSGYQSVEVNNYTGPDVGCAVNAPQYSVCNSLRFENWRMEIDFTAEVSGLAPTPLVFTSPGSQDDITPSLDSYTGDSNNPWSLQLDVTNANCSPTCDAVISQIVFSGVLDSTTLSIYNGNVGGPYATETLNSAEFTTTWVIPVTDYTDSPGLLSDQTDIVVTQTPEPASFALLLAAGLTLGFIKRARFLSIGR